MSQNQSPISTIPSTLTQTTWVNTTLPATVTVTPQLTITGGQTFSNGFWGDQTIQNTYYPIPVSIEQKMREEWDKEIDDLGINLRDLRRLIRMAKEDEGLKALLDQLVTFFRLRDEGVDPIQDAIELMNSYYNAAITTTGSLTGIQGIQVGQNVVNSIQVENSGSGY